MIYEIDQIHNTTLCPGTFLVKAPNKRAATLYAKHFCYTTINSHVTHVTLIEKPTQLQQQKAIEYPPNFDAEENALREKLAK